MPTPSLSLLAHAPAGFEGIIIAVEVIYSIVGLFVAILLPSLPAILLLRPRRPQPPGLPQVPSTSPLLPRLMGALFFTGFGLYAYMMAASFLLLFLLDDFILFLTFEEMKDVESHAPEVMLATGILFFVLEALAFLLRWYWLKRAAARVQ